VFLVGFALLVAFLAPGLYLRDSGELTTAAFTLGVAHETGFPLYCLLGKLASLLPFGEVAFRLALLSALSGALAAWAVYRCVRELGESAVAGLGAAAILLSGLTFWKSASVAEVYAPTAAALALGVWLLARAATEGGKRSEANAARGSAEPEARPRGDGRSGLLLALAGGLSLGLHAQLRLLLGPPAMVLALVRLRRGARWPLLGPLAVAVGAAVVAYLPLRAAAGPAANWSNPRTLGGVVRHIAAARIRAAFADQILTHDLRLAGERLANFFAQVEGQLGAIVLLVAAGGLVWLLMRSRAVGATLAFLLAGDALYSAWINPMGLDDLQCGAPTAVALALCAGAGLAAAARRFPERGRPFAAGALAVMALVPALLSDGDAKYGLGFEADAYARTALSEAPPRALLFATSDDLAAGGLYLQTVGGLRPDVTLLVRQQVDVGAFMNDRPMLWEPGPDHPPSGTLEVGWPLESLVAPSLPAPRIIELARQALSPARDPFARRLWATSLTGPGRLFLQRGDEISAEIMFQAALEVRPIDAVAATDLAVVRAHRGDFAGALALCVEVLARDPSRQVARLNAGRYRLALSDLDGAEREFREYARRAPREAAPLVGLARVMARRGDRAAAVELVGEALRLSPGYPEALALKRDLR
jgi:tetratricopeptide (TPR) repeat protein